METKYRALKAYKIIGKARDGGSRLGIQKCFQNMAELTY